MARELRLLLPTVMLFAAHVSAQTCTSSTEKGTNMATSTTVRTMCYEENFASTQGTIIGFGKPGTFAWSKQCQPNQTSANSCKLSSTIGPYSKDNFVHKCPANTNMPLKVAKGFQAQSTCCKTTIIATTCQNQVTDGCVCTTDLKSVGKTCSILSQASPGFCFAAKLNTTKFAFAVSDANCCENDAPNGCILIQGLTTGAVEPCINSFQSICYDPYGLSSSGSQTTNFLQFCGPYTIQINKKSKNNDQTLDGFNNSGNCFTSTYTKQTTSSAVIRGISPNCPANYKVQTGSLAYGILCRFCIPENCYSVRESNPTECVQCLPGFFEVADGSCQNQPSSNLIIDWINNVELTSGLYVTSSFVTVPCDIDSNGIQVVVTIRGLVSLVASKSGVTGLFPLPLKIDYNVTIAGSPDMLRPINNQVDRGQSTPTNYDVIFSEKLNLGANVISVSTSDFNLLVSEPLIVNIIVIDTQPPDLVCMSVSRDTISLVQPFAVFNWRQIINATSTGASVWDNVLVVGAVCTGGPANDQFTVNNNFNISCSATDSAGNSANCSYTVLVKNTLPPIINCPSSTIFVNLEPNQNRAVATWITTGTDLTAPPSITCIPPSGSEFSAGATSVSCEALNTVQLTSECTFSVEVTDVEKPVFTSCPSTTLVISSASSPANGSGASNQINIFHQVSAIDNVPGFYITCTPGGSSMLGGSFLSFPYGFTTVICVAFDLAGNSETCRFDVKVVDDSNPVLTCVSTTIRTSDEAASPKASNYSLLNSAYQASAQDNILVTGFKCLPINDNIKFPVGATNVTCTAMDAVGNLGTCVLQIVVVDSTLPSTTCPDQIRIASIVSQNMATWSLPIFSDNIGVVSTTLKAVQGKGANQTSTLLANDTTSFLIVGNPISVTFLFSAQDAQGNIDSCSWLASVASSTFVDTEPPTIINCPAGSQLVSNPISSPSTTFNDYPSSTYTETYFAASIAPGYGLVNWPNLKATDAQCANVENCAGVTPFYDPLLSESLNFCSLPSSAGPSGGSSVVCPGNYVVNFGAIDSAGNTAYCSYLLRVIDKTPPTFPVESLTRTYTTDCQSNSNLGEVALLQWPVPSMVPSDNFALPSLAYTGKCTSIPAGYCPLNGGPLVTALPLGVYNFTYEASDASGNMAIPVLFVITIKDVCPPQMYYDENDGFGPVSLSNNQFFMANEYTAPGESFTLITCPTITAQDNSFGALTYEYSSRDPTGLNCNSQIPISLKLGRQKSTVLLITISDAAGNKQIGNIQVTVHDYEPPELQGCGTFTSPVFIIATCDLGKNTATVAMPLVTATDNSGPVNVTSTNCTTNSATKLVTCLPYVYSTLVTVPCGPNLQGSTDVTYRTTDLATVVVGLIKILARDTQPPEILNFPGPIGTTVFTYTINNEFGFNYGLLTLPSLSAKDNVELVATFYTTHSPPYVSGQTFQFPIGRHEIMFTATDSSILSSTVSIIVLVNDVEPPHWIYCPSVLNCVGSGCYHLNKFTAPQLPAVVVNWQVPQAEDNADGTRVQYEMASQPAGYTREGLFPIGIVKMNYIAFDTAGNRVECSFFINVTDAEAPELTCPGTIEKITPELDITASNDTTGIKIFSYPAEVEVEWPLPTVKDNSNYAFFYVQAEVPPAVTYERGEMMQVGGPYNITYRAVDASGNSAICNFSVTILQRPIPQLSQASGSTSIVIPLAGAGGGFLLVLIIFAVFLIKSKRDAKKKMAAMQSGYAELMSMSDDFILERARIIQTSLMGMRNAEPPAAISGALIHPTRKFVSPPADLAGLEEYLRMTCKKEILREKLEFGAELGKGEFGAVWEGIFLRIPEKDNLKVAIKMMKKVSSEIDKCKFLKEAAIMCQFEHPNIVSLTGVCTLPPLEPILIVLEYMHLGALHGYLQSSMVVGQLPTLTMIRMALDIGLGMQYLAEASFVHRDLAARNVLIDNTMTCRIADFGLSVDLASAEAGSDDDNGAYAGTGADDKIPVRWSAIEAICFRQFSSASDVWSYGVVLWEIWAYAEIPYKGWPNKKVTVEVSNGYRMPKPSKCPDDIYKIMIECWNKNPKRRINFVKVNQLMIQAWKDVCKEEAGEDDGTNNNNLYDNQFEDDQGTSAKKEGLYDNAREIEADLLLDTRENEEGARWSQNGIKAQANTFTPLVLTEFVSSSSITHTPLINENYISSDVTEKFVENSDQSTRSVSVSDILSSLSLNSNNADSVKIEVEPVKIREVDTRIVRNDTVFEKRGSEMSLKPNTGSSMRQHHEFTIHDIGSRVMVESFCGGVLLFVGPHAKDYKARCGVELDEPIGLNNGTAGGHLYFTCPPKHGVLVDPRLVSPLKPLSSHAPSKMNAFTSLIDDGNDSSIYGSIPIFVEDNRTVKRKTPSGYIQIGESFRATKK